MRATTMKARPTEVAGLGDSVVVLVVGIPGPGKTTAPGAHRP